MPINKAASIRHRVMDQCFRNPGRKYFWEDLADACADAIQEIEGKSVNISRKTIYNDMTFLKSKPGGEAPIVNIIDNGRTYYTYEDKSFSIYNSPINPQEIDQLKDAVFLFSRIGGLKQFEWLQTIIPKLQIAVDDKIDSKIIDYESNEDLKNHHLVQKLFEHIRYKRALIINYKTFSDEELRVEFHPHLLKQYNSRWFLFGEVPKLRREEGIHPVNFPLDRIQTITTSKAKYRKNKEINYKDYFEEFIGVTKAGTKAYTIKFKVHESRYKYIASKPIHISQKFFKQIDETDWFASSINVIPNRELYQTLLSFGEDLIVLSPKDIKNKLTEACNTMAKNYR